MATVITTTFEFDGADGGPLRGDVKTTARGVDRPAVVICHGFKGFKNWGFFPKLAERLALAGCTAVSFNLTGSGVGPDGESFSEPERFGRATFSKDLEDIGLVCARTAAGSLSEGVAKPTKLGLFGHSRGGGMAVAHAALASDIAALVTWAAIGTVHRWPPETVERWRQDGRIDVPNARTGEILPLFTDLLDDVELHSKGKLDLAAAAAKVTAPWLIVHGDADEGVSVDEGRQLHAAAGGNATLSVLPGASHTMGARHPWGGFTKDLEVAMDETVGWFTENLL